MNTKGLLDAVLRTQAVVQFTPTGEIVDANDLFLSTMGYSKQELAGKHHRIFMVGDEGKSDAYAQFWKNLSEGKEQQGQFRRVTKKGDHVWLSATYTPIMEDGKVTSVIKLARVGQQRPQL